MKKRARIVSGLAALAALFLAPIAEASLTRSAAPRGEPPALALALAAPEPSEFSLFEGTEIARALASRPAFDLISITTDDAATAGRVRFVAPSELSTDELPNDAPELLPITSVREQRFNLHIPPDVFGLEPLRGPPGDEASYPKTRYRVFGLLGTPILGELRGVSLELHWRSASFSCGLAPGTVGWLSQDPMGDRDSPNLYGFVGARPHERTDPLGLMSEGDMLGRYLDDLGVMPRAEAQVRDRARRALSAEMDAQERAGRPSIVGSVLGEVWNWATGKGRQAQAASDRIENTLAGGARDLTTNVVPPSTRRVDTRDQRLPSEYGGGPTANDRLARAQNELSTTAGDVAEGGTRFGYETGRDYFILGTTGKALEEIRALRRAGRAGRQARLRELLNDPHVSAADRGWIQQELNEIERGKRKSIRVPPGSELSHERGREAAKGYSYRYSNLQDEDLHKIQHKYDDFGRKNPERPPIPEE